MTAFVAIASALGAAICLIVALVALVRRAGRAEAAARLSEDRLRGILESSTDWIWETDAAHRFTFYAPSLLGDPMNQPPIVLGDSSLSLQLSDDDAQAWAAHEAALSARLPFRDFEYPYVSRGGERRWARAHGRPVFDASGAFRGYRGTGRDITEERQAKQAVLESRSLLRAVVDAVPALVNVKDRAGRYMLMNAFQAKAYGTSPEAAVGRRSADFTGPDYGGESQRVDAAVVSTGHGTGFYERPFVDAEGTSRIWWTAKEPLTGPNGEVSSVVTVAMDITALKESERARRNLSRYFSPNMLELLARRDEPLGQVREQNVAVIFADLFEFTRFAARHPPEKVMATLRDLHARLTDIVLARGGTLEKFLGDGIMATFGTPAPTGLDATGALAAVQDIVLMIQAWNAERERRGDAVLRIGVGAHYGPVLLGEVGSERRVEYAVLGETVNLASRLQYLTRTLRTPAVVSRTLMDAASAEGREGSSLATSFSPAEAQPVDGLDAPVDVAVWPDAPPAEAHSASDHPPASPASTA